MPIDLIHRASRAHLAEVFRWSGETEIEMAEVLAAGIGMAGLVLAGALTGHLSLGLVASIGSLAVGRVEIAAGLRAHIRRELRALAVIALAACAALAIQGHGWGTPALLVPVAMAAGIIGGFSRPMVADSIRFILFLMIINAVASGASFPQDAHPGLLVGLVLAGAVWTSALSLVFGTIVRHSRGYINRPPKAPALSKRPEPTFQQKAERLKRSLEALAGWQYTLRLGGALTAAAMLAVVLPDHHIHWVGLTVALLTQRLLEPMPVKVTQRALGTAAGVVLADILFRQALPLWGMVAVVGVLAGLRPLLRNGNYLAYSVVMTPLVITLMDAGQPVEPAVLLDRLVATVVGAVLVVVANLIVGRLLPPQPAKPAADQ